LSALLTAGRVKRRLASRINGQRKRETVALSQDGYTIVYCTKGQFKKNAAWMRRTRFIQRWPRTLTRIGKKAMTNRLPNKQLRWTIFLGLLAFVYVGTFSAHEPATTKGDRQVAPRTGTDRKLTGLATGVEEDIGNYCKGDAACINNAYAQIERDKGRCATDADLQNFSRSYCEGFAVAAVVKNLKWGPGSDPIGLNSLAHLQRRMNALQREFN
jgi:hypothetical protein